MIPIGQNHWCEDEPHQPLSLYGLCVASRVWRDDPSLSSFLPQGRLCLGSTFVPQFRTSLRRLLFEQNRPRIGNHAAVLGSTLQLLVQLARIGSDLGPGDRREPTESNTRLRELIRAYVEDLRRDFREPAGLDHAAYRLGMSRRRFTQLFREAAGTSWSAFVKDGVSLASWLAIGTRAGGEVVSAEAY